ncbi:MAG: DUF4956 domain-containing protein [Ruminococcaceae bacterium]|nr:DUF4956 domain-containing protein [Oscillospiraceae bacterium]
MNQIIDFFRTTFESELQTTMSLDRIAIGLLVSFFLSLYILLIYRLTYQGVAFSKIFCFALLLLSMVTAVVIMTVTTNLALSLGMVGALSIVRFRTAVKDPMDTVFMFWAIGVGIMAGAGLVYISLITNIGLGALYLLLYFLSKKVSSSPYLLVVRYRADSREEVEIALRSLSKLKIKSKIVRDGAVELCLETKMTPKLLPLVEDLGKLDGVIDASTVSYGSDTTL